jgi:hypothetical protein
MPSLSEASITDPLSPLHITQLPNEVVFLICRAGQTGDDESILLNNGREDTVVDPTSMSLAATCKVRTRSDKAGGQGAD